jgi:hypothetical protein
MALRGPNAVGCGGYIRRRGAGRWWGGGAGSHSSPALSHIKVGHAEHVDVTICEICIRVFGTNVGA